MGMLYTVGKRTGGIFAIAIGTVTFCAPLDSLAATYHLRADGTATSKPFSTSCKSSETAMSLSFQNSVSYEPGDRVILCSEGGVYRDTFWPPSGGSADFPIIYDGLGRAVVSGSDLIKGWTGSGTNQYSSLVLVQPSQVFIDGAFGDRKSELGLLTDDLDWYWESNTLYLHSSGGNPDEIYSSPGVESSARDIAVGIGSTDHIVIQGVTAKHANYSGIKGWNPGSHIKIQNCMAEWNWQSGIDLNGNSIYEQITLEDNVVRYNGTGGIVFLSTGRDSMIRRNSCYENGKYQSEGGDFDFQHQWTYGIKLWENTGMIEGVVINQNDCYGNGRGVPGDFSGRGVGIWLDGVPGNPDNPIIIGQNLVHGNSGNGIFIELSSNTVTQGNVVFDNASNSGGDGDFAPANIRIDSREGWTTENNLVHNNTMFGGRVGILVSTYNQHDGCSVRNNVFRNNISVNSIEHDLYCNRGGDNDGVNGTGNLYEFNSFGEAWNGFISWGGNLVGSYSAWEDLYGAPSFSIVGDPRLVDPAKNKFFLGFDSPCRDAGVNLGEGFDEGLLSPSAWTGRVQTVDQDLIGGGWEVGAYAYREYVRRLNPADRHSPAPAKNSAKLYLTTVLLGVLGIFLACIALVTRVVAG